MRLFRFLAASVVAARCGLAASAQVSIQPVLIPNASMDTAAINLQGQVAGYTTTHLGFLWTPSTSIVGLGGPGDFRPFAINNQGHLAGATFPNGVSAAGLWSPTGGTMPLGINGFSTAYDLNNINQVVGSFASGNQTNAFLWQNGQYQTIGTLGLHSIATAVNDTGIVAGQSQTFANVWHAFRWTASTGMIDIGSLGGDATVNDMNSQGFVTGWSVVTGNIEHAVLWSPTGGILDLGTLGTNLSHADGINDLNEVVGSSRVVGFGDQAFIWSQGLGMRNLNSLLPANSGWELFEAFDINDNDQIVGRGLFNNQPMLFVMSLHPVPSPGGLWLVSACMLLRRRGLRADMRRRCSDRLTL